jgi:Uma2 family endonuclease
MQTAVNRDYLSVDDYLAGEEVSDVKHEYAAGSVYEIAGVTREHNRIAGNIYTEFEHNVRETG